MPLDVNAPRGISFGFQALARMKPGVALAQANADVARMISLLGRGIYTYTWPAVNALNPPRWQKPS